MKDIMPGDLVSHRHSDRYGLGIVLKVWYEEELIAEVKWARGWDRVENQFAHVRAAYLELVSDKL